MPKSTRTVTREFVIGTLGYIALATLTIPPAVALTEPKPIVKFEVSRGIVLTPKQSDVPKYLRNPAYAEPKSTSAIAAKTWYAGKKILSARELSYLLYEAGFRGRSHKVAFGVAMRESTGRPRSFNGICYGLFQINMNGSLGDTRLERLKLQKREDLFDPLVAAKSAYFMTSRGKTWTAWSIDLKTGKGLHLIARFMPKYPGIVKSLGKN